MDLYENNNYIDSLSAPLSPDVWERLQRDFPNSEFHHVDNSQKIVTGNCKHKRVTRDGTHWCCEECGLGGWGPVPVAVQASDSGSHEPELTN